MLATVSERRDRPRVVVLLSNAQNRLLIAQELQASCDVAVDLPEPSGDEGTFDLCLVDESALRYFGTRLARERARVYPVFLPVLLLTEPRAAPPPSAVRDLIDDVLRRPVDRSELAVRMETLLRTRNMSLALRRTAELYRRERRVTERLQSAAMPRHLPLIAGLTFDASYVAASDEARVGGDWYDVLRLADGRIVITIGDVSGSGLEAAVVMAATRQVLRGVAHIHPAPAMMLEAADRTLQSEDGERLVTAFTGVFDPLTRELTYATAGHPPPMLRRADGSVMPLDGDGVPLGLHTRQLRREEHLTLDDGALLVLYTDGLTEAGRDPVAGEAYLTSVVGDPAVAASPAPAQTIRDRVLTRFAHGAGAGDDVAIVTMRIDAAAAQVSLRRWTFPSADEMEARRARREFSAALQAHGFDAGALMAAEMIFAELLGNVVRYAAGTVSLALDLDTPLPVLHVIDHGRGFRYAPRLPRDPLSERGRGLYIVAQLAEDVSATTRWSGGSHVRVVLSATTTPLAVGDAMLNLAT